MPGNKIKYCGSLGTKEIQPRPQHFNPCIQIIHIIMGRSSSWVRCIFGNIFILSASGHTSERETQFETCGFQGRGNVNSDELQDILSLS